MEATSNFPKFVPMHIKQASYLISSPAVEKCPPPDYPEFAFIGRSNVGKSSLINMLCLNDKLAKTSNKPGKTQLINHFTIISSPSPNDPRQSKWYLVDLPGYGYAKISIAQRKAWERMIESYLRTRQNLKNVFVLIDSRHPPQKIDLEFVEALNVWGVPYSIVFTKTDKEKQSVVSKNVKMFLEALRERQQFLPASVLTSSQKKTGRTKLLQFVAEMLFE